MKQCANHRESRKLRLRRCLERGDLARICRLPIPIATGGPTSSFSVARTAGFGHKDVSFDPAAAAWVSIGECTALEARRLTDVLSDFSRAAIGWVKARFPAYASQIVADRVTLRTQEEATRALRVTARNDLLHVDNFPTRATIRPADPAAVREHPARPSPQVWATSERFPAVAGRVLRPAIASRHCTRCGVDGADAVGRPAVHPASGRSGPAYDAWMLRLHHFLKEDEMFQAQAARRMWTFPPRSMWLLFSDGVAHAQLRGRFALDHSFFVPQSALTRPAESPLAMLRAGNGSSSHRAGQACRIAACSSTSPADSGSSSYPPVCARCEQLIPNPVDDFCPDCILP